MKITDDSGFDRANEWLIKRGEMVAMIDLEIKNPLLGAQRREQLQSERAEHMRKYDLVDAEMARYKKILFGTEHKTALDAWLDD